jgi:hypothetical protein
MTIPNFFIVGAPKTGTTALASYLADHPRVFMSPVKEPHYFAKDIQRPSWVHDKVRYMSLFHNVTGEHLATGEASVWYFFSAVAVKNIREYNPDAKIIVMLRNPIDLVSSLHSQLLFSMCEDQSSLEKAWRLQEDRANGRQLPKSVKMGRFPAKCLQYAQVAKFGEQLERVLDIFPASQVKVILYDDFKACPAVVYEETLSFLGVPSDGRTDFLPVNENKVLRFKWLGNPINNGGRLGGIILSLKRRLGLPSLGLIGCLAKLNGRRTARVTLGAAFHRELAEEFRDDIYRTGKLVNRDLSSWLRIAGQRDEIVQEPEQCSLGISSPSSPIV